MDFVKSQEKKLYRRVVQYGPKADETITDFKPSCHIKKITKNLYVKGYWTWLQKRDNTERLDADGKIDKWPNYKTVYEFVSDGEVFEMADKKPDEFGVMRNKKSLRKIFCDMRRLITMNFDDCQDKRSLFITLTYRENMQDDKRLYVDFNNFMTKLKANKLKEHELLYIVIMEPQARGAWHAHLLLKTLNQDSLFIDYRELETLWGHGATSISQLKTDDIGSYFVAYMSNASLDDAKVEQLQIPDADIRVAIDPVDKLPKRYIKGTRLCMYPDYMKIYRNSRNVRKPSRAYINADNLHSKYPVVLYEFEKTIDLSDERTLSVKRIQRRKSSRTK